MTLLILAAGGALGAVSRYLVQGWVQDLAGGRFPWGTFAVNISGSFALGLVFALAMEREFLSPDVRLPLMVGFIGSYTTFSTLMLDSWALADEGDLGHLLINLIGSVAIGMVALVAGLAVGRLLPS